MRVSLLARVRTCVHRPSFLRSFPHAALPRPPRCRRQLVYGVEPDLTREGGSIPVTLTFQEATGKNVMLLPMGAADDGAHSQNEKIDVRNYISGTKLLAAYLQELAKVNECKC